MRPRLIHPVEIKVKRYLPDDTEMDEDFREPVTGAAGVTYAEESAMMAQVSFGTFENRSMVAGGDSPNSSGYLLFDKAKYTLAKSDKIESIDGTPLHNVYVVSIEPATAYGKFYFTRAVFEERKKG